VKATVLPLCDFLSRRAEQKQASRRFAFGARKLLRFDLPGRIYGQNAFLGQPGKEHPDREHLLLVRIEISKNHRDSDRSQKKDDPGPVQLRNWRDISHEDPNRLNQQYLTIPIPSPFKSGVRMVT
jgi:hypothetical protein